jgi:EmrB/QacA subfamily drug resistance transporter
MQHDVTIDADPRRWFVMVFIALAQLMLVLDVTIVNIALPTMQRSLDLTDANRQWVITAYTLTFGGFLLLGGRVADYVGRKRTLIIGLSGFALASAVGGLADNIALLVVARAAQGLFGALLAPSNLSLLTTTFSNPKERAKAFGIFGAVAGGGSAVGLIVGGLLTEYLSWRWTFYINVPVAIAAVIGISRLVAHDRTPGQRKGFDLAGALLATAGLVSLVYGFNKAETDGWGAGVTLGLLAAGVALLAVFVIYELRTTAPLLPMRIITERNRAGAYLAVLGNAMALFGTFFFLTFFLQGIKDYSPVKTGFAFLPMTAGVVLNANLGSRLITRTQPRFLIGGGLGLMAAGLFLLSRIHIESSYLSHVLLPFVLIGLGLGWIMTTSINVATTGVERADAGVAGAMVNTSQQIGASIGTSLLSTIAASATTDYVRTHAASPLVALEGAVHGYNVASIWSAGILVVAIVLVASAVNVKSIGGRVPAREGAAEPAPEIVTAVH